MGADDDAAEVSPPGALPDEVTYDIGGGPSPEFVSIRGEVPGSPRDTERSVVGQRPQPGLDPGRCASSPQGAVWYQTNQGRTGLERRLTELEDQVRAAGGGGSA